MSLRTVVYARCTAHSGLSALIGKRCYPDVLPENVTYPALRYARISTTNEQYRISTPTPTTREEARVQFDCFAESGDAAAALADQVRLAWDGYQNGCTVGRAFQANRIETYEDGLGVYRTIVDMIIEYAV